MSVGLIGISLATAIVIFAFMVSISANQRRMLNGDIDRAYSLGFSNLYALVAFGGLFTYAIRNRTRSEVHKRAILFSTFVLLNPPLGRLFRPVFDPAPVAPWLVFGIIDMLVLACLIFDWRRLGRLHPATVAGAVVVVLSQAIRGFVPELTIWRSSYDAILRLVS